MSKAHWIFIGLSLMVSATAFAQTTNKIIECKEFSPFEPTDEDSQEHKPQGVYKVKLDEKGDAIEVSIERKAVEGFAAIKETLNLKNSTITHEIRDGTIDGIDEETKEPMYSWNIKKVETLSFSSRQMSLEIKLNDHLYAGVPGSFVELSIGDKKTSSTKDGHTVSCTGPSRIDGNLRD